MSDLRIGKECGGGRLGDVKVPVETSLKILCPFDSTKTIMKWQSCKLKFGTATN